ncbi:MAG TPA: hypothetical protein VKB34_14755 [Povalibacter sp.]|nr:hypothetical protein [Povalibacter sp.]
MLHREISATALDTARHELRAAALSWLLLTLCMQWPVTVRAADELDIALVAEVREDVEVTPGRKIARLIPATALHQGQEIFYTVRIRNPAAVPARDVEVVQRIPENTVYVANSAGGPGADIAISADGGQNFGREGQLTVVDQSALALMQAPSTDRESLTRPATPQDYTHIRWHLRNPLAPGAIALARFRAVFQ